MTSLIFKIDEEITEKISVKVSNPAKISSILANHEIWPFFRIRFSTKKIISMGKEYLSENNNNWQSKEQKYNNKTPNNESVIAYIYNL